MIFLKRFKEELRCGIAPERTELYRICEREEVGITVMKGYAGGRLFSAGVSPSAALTPVQCLHYALTRPAVASIMVGYDTPEHVAAAVAYEYARLRKKKITRPCLQEHLTTRTPASVRTAATVRRVRRPLISPW